MDDDVEFYEKDALQIPVRTDPPPDGILSKKLVDKKIAPTGKWANYYLVGFSIIILFVALIFFALYTQI